MKTSFVVAFGVAQTIPATAAQITGEVKAANEPIIARLLGYTKTRIVAASAALRNKKEDLALYLEVKNSLPLKAPTEKRKVKIHGMSFEPAVTACVFEEIIVFSNEDRARVTVVVNDKPIGSIEPREELNFKCETKGIARIRLQQKKHARATLFVGTTGVASRPDANGKFLMAAPEGTYELKVINSDGIVHSTAVEVGTEDLDLGLLGAEQSAEEIPADSTATDGATAGEAAAPPGPKIVIPPPAAIPPPPANALRQPKAPAIPAANMPKPVPAPAAVKFPTPKTKPALAKPTPAVKTAPAAAVPPPKKKAAATVAPAPKPKPKPKPVEEEDSLDEFFEMEE